MCFWRESQRRTVHFFWSGVPLVLVCTTMDDFIVRDFVAADDAACKELENSASQVHLLNRTIRLAHLHYHRFDAKLEYFQRDKSFVLVAQDGHPICQDGQHICGVVAVGVKRAHVHGAQHLCGFVHDLRVHPSRQGRGIGRLLTMELEARCRARGVDVLYLSVNRDNRRARRLYSRVGYTAASSRVLLVQPLLLPSWPRSTAREGCTLKALTAAEATELLWRHYGRRDLGLDRAGYGELCASHFFLGCWILSDRDGSYASLSLWNGSELGGFAVIIIIIISSENDPFLPYVGARFCHISGLNSPRIGKQDNRIPQHH